MTPINKHLKLSLSTSIFLLLQILAYGQAEDSLAVVQDTSKITFTKVMLDGRVNFRNEKTNQFISQSEYLLLRDAGLVDIPCWHNRCTKK